MQLLVSETRGLSGLLGGLKRKHQIGIQVMKKDKTGMNITKQKEIIRLYGPGNGDNMRMDDFAALLLEKNLVKTLPEGRAMWFRVRDYLGRLRSMGKGE